MLYLAVASKKPTPKGTPALSHNPFGALAPSGDLPPGPVRSEPAEPAEAGAAPASALATGKVVVRRGKKGRKGKTVTRSSGLEPAALETLQKKMKKSLGCGAVIEGDDLLLLGSLVERAAKYLRDQAIHHVVEAN